MASHKVFDVDITYDVNPASLAWPGDGMSDLGFTGNRDFDDFRGINWQEAEEAYLQEAAIIARIEAASSSEAEYEAILEGLYEEPNSMYGLDIGIASAVMALAATRCIPISSCNAGTFGDWHREDFPLVALYVRPQAFDQLMRCATHVGAGFSNSDNGSAIIYAKQIPTMMQLARLLIDRRFDFSS